MDERRDRQHGGRWAARTLPSALLLVGALAGCTAPPATPVGAPTPAAAPATPGIGSAVSVPATAPATSGAAVPTTAPAQVVLGPEQQRVADALRSYLGAVASGDFTAACGALTVESAAALVTAVQGAGAAAPTCPDALGAVLLQPGAAQTAIDAASTTAVDEVTVDGLTATVRWTSVQRGVSRSDALTMQSVDGQWRLAGPA